MLGMENDGAGVFLHIQLDTNDTGEVEGGEVGVKGQVIVEGEDGFGKPHAIPGERLAIGGYKGILDLAFIW